MGGACGRPMLVSGGESVVCSAVDAVYYVEADVGVDYVFDYWHESVCLGE